MLFAAVIVCHVLGAISVGPIFTLPFLAATPSALHAVLVLLRFSAGVTLLTGILLWVVLHPAHPLWLYLSSAFFVALVAAIAVVLVPAAEALSAKPELRGRIRWTGIAASALTVCIAILMTLRPNWA